MSSRQPHGQPGAPVWRPPPTPPNKKLPTVAIVLTVVIGVPLLTCGGCLGLGAIGSLISPDDPPESNTTAKPPERKPPGSEDKDEDKGPRPTESQDDGLAAPEPDLTEAKVTALRILRDTETLLRQGKAMEPLRTSAGTGALARCGQLMRERQPKAESLGDESMRLPLAVRANLAATGHAVLCVSCLKDAKDYCQMGEQSLKAGRAALSEM